MAYNSRTFYNPRDYNLQKNNRTSNTEEVENIFNKRFEFQKNDLWRLPDFQTWFTKKKWFISNLDHLKSKLNFYKSQLNDFNIEEWSLHTRKRNPAGDVLSRIRHNLNPEFLTQAWTKFYECAYTYNIVPDIAKEKGEMVSLHLCEAPGAFIASLNHYLKTHHPLINWKWLASTLNPYYEGNSPSYMISDDRFMFYTLENWNFGSDKTGNLMDWENSQTIIEKSRSLGQVLLVTADGSIDCLEKPDAQEELTSHLHYCEVVTALLALDRGGNLITKFFTMFEDKTICLLYLLNNLFQSVNIYKPVTSKCGNSEVYAVCLNYCGSNLLKGCFDKLKLGFIPELYKSFPMFSQDDVPKDFVQQVEDCAQFFCDIQCRVINENLQAYLIPSQAGYNETKRLKYATALVFMTHYDLRPISIDQEILKGLLHEQMKINMNPRHHKGSYTERQHYGVMSVSDKCKNIQEYFTSNIVSNTSLFLTDTVKWMVFFDPEWNVDFVFTVGKPLQQIESSQFLFYPLLKLYKRIMKDLQIKVSENSFSSSIEDHSESFKPSFCSKVLRFTDNWECENYDCIEKTGLNLLLKSLESLKDGDVLLIENFNLLTQFNVGICYVLCKSLFKSVGFTNSSVIIFKDYVINPVVMSRLRGLQRQRETGSLLAILPIRLTNTGDYHDVVLKYNNTQYRRKCQSSMLSVT